jgi:energy-coupling factor transporter ATP-binding protein EcfA2
VTDVQKELEDWLHSQEDWLQAAAEKLAHTGEPLTDSDIDEITALLKTPEGRKKTSHRKYPQLVHGTSAGPNVRLVSIGNVEGIDRLAPRTPLSFGDKPLCVIYGHNGSGKSGYTRILARASGKPRAASLRPNAYASEPVAQKCTITYSLNGVEQAVEWDPKSGPIEDLRCIDIFDTDTAEHYLSQETTASYSPPAVTLLDRLAKTCDRINARLQEEQNACRSTPPRIPSHLKDTEIACAYGGLNADTPPEEVQRLTKWTQEDEDLLADLDAALKATDPATEAKASQNSERFTRKLLEDLQGIALALSSERLGAIREARATAITTRTIAQEAATAATDKAMIDGVGTETWKALWRAAREFSQTPYPTLPFPHTEAEARCVLCHQEIGVEAAERLAAFDAFTQGKVSRDADLAEEAYKRALAELPLLPTSETVAERCHAAQLPAAWVDILHSFLSAAADTTRRLRDHEDAGTAVPIVLDATFAAALNAHAQSLALKAHSLKAIGSAEAREATSKHFAELEAQKWAAERRPDIADHLAAKKVFISLDALKKATSSLSVSYKARDISKVLINEAYIDRFHSELHALGAHRIRVEVVQTRVEKGTPYLQVRLKDESTAVGGPDAVLSEGERRIVALAAFLADVTAAPPDVPFIFDDPITSLDQDYEALAVKRLNELSMSRQVIVLTHRLGFVGTMVDLSRDRIVSTEIRGRDRHTGRPAIITTYGLKPLSALNTLKSLHVERARRAYAEDEDVYRSLAKELCSDIRIHVERIVESYITCGIVERHRRPIETNRMRLLERVTKEDHAIISRYMTKYSCYEHSQPVESPVPIPEPDEIEADLNELITWLGPLVARLNK